MAEIERLTITLRSGMVEAVKNAVNDGDHASTSEVVRDALRDWNLKRALRLQELAALNREIDKGLADVAAGRVKDFVSEEVATRLVRAIAAAFAPVRCFLLAAPARDFIAPGLRVTFHRAYAIYYHQWVSATT